MVDKVKRANGKPSVKVLVKSLQDLPSELQLPGFNGKNVMQHVEYGGLPGQCFICNGNHRNCITVIDHMYKIIDSHKQEWIVCNKIGDQ